MQRSIWKPRLGRRKSPTIFKHLALAAAARIGTLPITAAGALAFTAVAIGYGGPQEFAAITLIGTLFLLVPFSDMGLGAVVINVVATRGQSDSTERAAQATVWRVITRLSVVSLVLVAVNLCLAIGGLWRPLLGLDHLDRIEADWIIFCALLPIALSVPFGVGQRILVGLQRTHLASLYMAIVPVVGLGAAGVVVWLGFNPLWLAISTPLGVLASGLLSTWRSMALLGWHPRQMASFSRAADGSFRLWGAAVPMLIISIGSPLALQSHRLLLSHFGTTTELAQYSLGAQFYAPALSVVTTTSMALWPHFLGRMEDRRRDLSVSIAAFAGIGVLAALAFTLLVPFVAGLVGLGEVSVPGGLAGAFAAQLLVMALHQPSAMLMTDAAGLRFQAICILAFGVVVVSASALVIPYLGAAGPLLVSAAALTCTTLVPCLIYSYRMLKRG